MKTNHISKWMIFGLVLSCLGILSQDVFAQDLYFQDIAVQAGLQDTIDRIQYGVAFGDFDGDGNEDCFVATHPSNQLFRNQGEGSFVEIGVSAGIGDPDFGASGGSWGDYDGDHDLDLFVTNLDAEESSDSPYVPNRLFQNNGNGTFTDVAEAAGVSGIVQEVTGASTHSVWFDYNQDNHLDLLVCNRVRGALLYRNDGNGAFSYVSVEAGLVHDESEGHEEEEENEMHSVEHAACADYDNDGYPDIYFSVAVAEEHHHDENGNEIEEEHEDEASTTANFLFHNNGDGTFSDVTENAGLFEANLAVTHTSVWGDYDNDGDPDLFVGNLGSVNEGSAVASQLFRNEGNGTFTNVSTQAGFVENYYTFNAAWVDVNNDGYLDLSMVYHPSHDDFPAGTLYQTPHPLYLSNGDGTFTNINATTEDALLTTGLTDISHLIGLAWDDMDNDGDLDAVYTENHGDGPIRLYQNQTLAKGKHWLQISPRMDSANFYAIGAKVYVTAGERSQLQLMGQGNAGWGSNSPLRLHFGLGEELSASVIIQWPDRRIESFGQITADQSVVLVYGQGETVTSVNEWELY